MSFNNHAGAVRTSFTNPVMDLLGSIDVIDMTASNGPRRVSATEFAGGKGWDTTSSQMSPCAASETVFADYDAAVWQACLSGVGVYSPSPDRAYLLDADSDLLWEESTTQGTAVELYNRLADLLVDADSELFFVNALTDDGVVEVIPQFAGLSTASEVK